MKRVFILLGLILFVAALEAWAVPPLPHTFYGTVKQNGANVPSGTVVTAWIGGIQYVSTATFMSGIDSVYTLNVPGDDPGTSAKDGGVNGDTISFNVGGDQAATTAFSSGATTGLNLSIVGQYALAISISPSGTGAVSKNPDKNAYSLGEQVTLTATPNSGYGFGSWSGDVSGTSNPSVLTMSGNKSVTANFTAVPEAVSTPSVLTGPTSGTTGNSYSYSTGGSSSNLGHPVEYQFDWKGDGTDLSAWGASSQPKTWTTAGTCQVRARARCTTHTSVVSTWSNGLSVNISQSQATVSCIFATIPSGLQVAVDGSTYTSPHTFSWAPGSSHTIFVSSIQLGGFGTQYVFGSWSDGGAVTHTIIVPSSSASYTASFTTQYGLTTSIAPAGGGTVSPSGANWYNSGQTVWISALANAGYSFNGWSGDLAGSSNPAILTMNGPKNVIANFVASASASGTLTVTPPVGLTSSGNTGGPYSPASQSYVLENTGVGAINWSVTKTQSWVSLSQSSGNLNPGTSVTVTVSINSGANTLGIGSYSDTISFTNLTNGIGSTARSVLLSVGAGLQPYTIATSPSGLLVVVDGAEYHSPQSFGWAPYSPHTVSVASPQSEAGGVRHVFASWSDGGGQSHTVTAAASSATYTAAFDTQYSLKTSANPPEGGTVTPSGENWFNSGQSVSVSEALNPGYQFSNWSGDAAGSANPVSIVMNGPKSVAASFLSVQSESFAVLPPDPLSATGRQGGVFSPSSQTCTVKNLGAAKLKWKVTKKARWVSLSKTSGTLEAGGTDQVILSVNTGAKQLKQGSYTDTIRFSSGSESVSKTATLAVDPQIKTYVVEANSEGLQVVIDGVAYASSQTFEWTVGSSHVLEVPSPQPGSVGSQYVFKSWSDRKPRVHTITAPSTGGSYVANFAVQYQVTTSLNPPGAGLVIPSGTSWINEGQKLSFTAKTNGGYQFVGWEGDISGSSNPSSVNVKGPMTVEATFVNQGGKGPSGASASSSPFDKRNGLSIVGALESPTDGKAVFGLKPIYGWALDAEGISKVRFFLDGAYICDIPYGGLREDLKEAYPDYPNAEKGGFALVWNYSSLPPGPHPVLVEIENVRGEILRLGANVIVSNSPGETIAQVSPKEWLVPGASLVVDGITKTYDLRLEWSDNTKSFEITDIYPQ